MTVAEKRNPYWCCAGIMLTFETAAKIFFRSQTVCAKFYIGTSLTNLELARDLEYVFERRDQSAINSIGD